MNICHLIIAGILWAIGGSECLECFDCQNIADPPTCTNTSQCSSNESCYLQTLHSGNEIRYIMGCQNNQLCSAAVNPNPIGRSIQARQQYSCHECCSRNSCNAQLCAHKKPTSCIDDVNLDCAHLNSIFRVCADVHAAKLTCPKFCGLCQLVDGNWAEWAAWTTCSVTCENGTQSRTRDCTNPAPSNGGLNCTGPSFDSKKCSTQLCPVHGNWSDWTTWSACAVTCDVGLRKRSRSCNNPKPDRFGDNCFGDPFENTICLQEPCSNRNGGWSSWGSWQSCSVTCGGGLKLRDRTCTSPSPTLYGKGCEGNSEAFAVCANTPCHVVVFRAEGFNELANKVNAFPTVTFNEGNAYNASTGHFTAPVDGMYYFNAQMTVKTHQSITFYIQKGSALGTTTLQYKSTYNYDPNSYLSSLASWSVKLTRNEHVWVWMYDHYTSADIYGGSWSSFTGMLIQEL